MNRVIDINISGFRLVKHGNAAGAQGEANVTALRLTFDETWDGYAKKVTFWDAYGKNPVERTLTTDLLENAATDTRVYLCPIPAEPLAIPGECVFVIDGYADGKRPRSLEGTLKVWPSRMTDNAGQPVDPTPTQAEQLQVQIDTIMEDIGRAAQASDAKEAAEAAAQRAEQAAADVNTGVAAAAEKAEEAAASAQAAKASETTAVANAQAAAQSAAAVAANAASVSTDAAAAKASAEAAARSETNAKASEEAAVSAKETVVTATAEAKQSAQTATQKAQSASQSASAASAAETAAKAAQKAAEQARDEAQSAAGGDFATKLYVDNKAGTAEANANKYTDQKIAGLPTPDVSGQINAHDSDEDAHNGVRKEVEGKVAKTGDTMTGTLQLQPEDSAGYGRIYKNANADGDYGLQLQDVDPDGNFMGLTLSGKLQKLEFKKKKAGDAGYTYTKLYDEDNPPSAYEVGALSEDGGTVWGDVTVENLYAKVNAQVGEGHTSTLMKNADAENDYGTILRDTNGEDVAELKLNAAEGSLKVQLGGEEQTVYHTGNPPTAADIGVTAAKKEIARITTSGTWVCPEGVTEIDAYLVGGGESGALQSSSACKGGAGGYAWLAEKIEVTPGEGYDITIGAGGARVANAYGNGKAGGDTVAFGFTAYGGGKTKAGVAKYGNGGNNAPNYNADGKIGGDLSSGWVYQINPYDGLPYGNSGGGGGYAGGGALAFVGKNIGGAGAKDTNTNYSNKVQAVDGSDGGGEGGYGSFAGGGAGGAGGGGGAAAGTGTSQNNYSGTYSGAGGAGIVIIYA